MPVKVYSVKCSVNSYGCGGTFFFLILNFKFRDIVFCMSDIQHSCINFAISLNFPDLFFFLGGGGGGWGGAQWLSGRVLDLRPRG